MQIYAINNNKSINNVKIRKNNNMQTSHNGLDQIHNGIESWPTVK